MAGLLLKELLVNKKTILLIWGGIVFMSVFLYIPCSDSFDGADTAYTFLITTDLIVVYLLNSILQQSIFLPDERKHWTDFIVSSPVTSKGQVLSKYYFSLISSSAVLMYLYLALSINAVIQGHDSSAVSFAIIMFFIQIITRSIEFPFIIRFGSKYGNNYRTIIFICMFFILAVYLLFGDLSIFGTFDGFMEWFSRLLKAEAFSDCMLASALCIPGILYCLSYKISCRMYLKGACNYDQ